MPGELIFLVSPDDTARERLAEALHEQGYQVAALADGGGSPLLQALRRNPVSAEVPVLLLSGTGQDERLRALRLAIADVVPPPHDAEEVVLTTRLALERACNRAASTRRLTGSIQLLSPADLLRTMEAGHRSGVLVFRSEGRSITLWVMEGHVVDAELDDGRRGGQAVYALLRWSEGTFEASFGPVSVPERIRQSTGALLLEGLRRLDELARDAAPPFAALADPRRRRPGMCSPRTAP